MKGLSIIVPVYNVYQELPYCINSILKQTYTDFELILVDDGSNDGSEKICDDYSKSDKRIYVIHQKNQGVSAARNTGLRVAKGEYIGFVDADDWIAPDMYECFITNMKKADVDIGICGIMKVDADNKQSFIMPSLPEMLSRTEAMECLLRESFSGSLCNKVYKHDVIQNLYIPTDILSLEDYLLNILIFAKSLKSKVFYIQEAKYFYRQRSGSSTHTLDLKYTLSYLYVFRRIRRIIYYNYPQLFEVYWEIYKKYLVHGLIDFLQLNNKIGKKFFIQYRKILLKVISRQLKPKDFIYITFFSNTYSVCYFLLKMAGLEKHNSTNRLKKWIKKSYE